MEGINFWKPDEKRAELDIETTTEGTSVTVYSCADKLKILISENGAIDIE